MSSVDYSHMDYKEQYELALERIGMFDRDVARRGLQ